MSASTISREVQAFATAVRAQLDDLPSDDVDDLTEGLEADLAEGIADARADAGADASSGADGRPDSGAGADGPSGSGADTHADAHAETAAARLGDPVTYAAELRAAEVKAAADPNHQGSMRQYIAALRRSDAEKAIATQEEAAEE